MKKITLLIVAGILSFFSAYGQEEDVVRANFVAYNISTNLTKVYWNKATVVVANSEAESQYGFSFFPVDSIDTEVIDSVSYDFKYNTVDPSNATVEVEFFYRTPFVSPRWENMDYPDSCVVLGSMMLSDTAEYHFTSEALKDYVEQQIIDSVGTLHIIMRTVGTDTKIGFAGKVDGIFQPTLTINPVSEATALTSNSVSKLSLFPQPVNNGMLNISGVEVVSAEVFSLMGSCLLLPNVVANQVNVSALNAGVYFIRMNTQQRTIVKQFIVE